jgi:hypothetical protein
VCVCEWAWSQLPEKGICAQTFEQEREREGERQKERERERKKERERERERARARECVLVPIRAL